MFDHELPPAFDLGAFRDAVARYVKLLIRARWKDEPGFLCEAALKDWGLLNIGDDPYPSWRLLEEAAEALGVLNSEFIPRCPSGGVPAVTEDALDTPAVRLMDEIAFLAITEGGGPYHNVALLTAAECLRQRRRLDWASLVEWSKLPSIRKDLDQLPRPRRSKPPGPEGGGDTDRAGRNVLRWQGKRWDLVFQGGPILLPNSVGLFYLGELVNKPGDWITASELRRAHASWRADPASLPRRQAENVTRSRRRHRDDDGDSGEVSGAPGEDLGEELDDEARANYLSRIASLPAEIESLELQGSTARAKEARREMLELQSTYHASLNRDGRPKRISETRKKDRDSVCKAIRRMLEQLRTAGPEFHQHLRLTMKLGWKCCYTPRGTRRDISDWDDYDSFAALAASEVSSTRVVTQRDTLWLGFACS